MNEHLEVDVWVDFVGPGHCEMQPTQSLHIVVLSSEKRLKPLREHNVQIPLSTELQMFSWVNFLVRTKEFFKCYHLFIVSVYMPAHKATEMSIQKCQRKV